MLAALMAFALLFLLLTSDAAGGVPASVNWMDLLAPREAAPARYAGVRLQPGGQAVGVALQTRGILVVGAAGEGGDSPGVRAGLRAGDMLRSADGVELQSAEHLTELVKAGGGKAMTLEYSREGKPGRVSVVPLYDETSGAFKLGVWVRDSTAGVGTLSFFDARTGAFGALGHAITDADTGSMLAVRQGNVMTADIVEIRRGSRGTPGELRGSFLRQQRVLGELSENGVYGVYGMADAPIQNPLYPDGLPVGGQEDVHTGRASILATVDDRGVREYDVEITRVTRQSSPAQKSLVLRVTDEELLDLTGGIVQGMSGSPILQDGRIIGAVTHVFVNDPTQGYGLFIEWMLERADEAAPENAA